MSSSPPVDAGKPFIFPSSGGVNAGGATPKSDAAGNAGHAQAGGGGAGGRGQGGGHASSSGGGPSGRPMGQLPVELQDMMRSRSTTSSSSRQASSSSHKPGGGGAAEAGGGGEDQATRRSSRAIKRKRFDDEIVDTAPWPATPSVPSSPLPAAPSSASSPALNASSLTSAAAAANDLSTLAASGSAASSSANSPADASASATSSSAARACSTGKGGGKIGSSKKVHVDELDPAVANSRSAWKKKSSKKSQRVKREGAWKDLSRWKPTDDLALITAVQQTNDLPTVHRGVKFSCHFKLLEIQERWHALFFEPIISKLAIQAIKNLSPEVVLSVQRKTLFSQAEQDLLCTIKAGTNPAPTIKDFGQLLRTHPQTFHPARTARTLSSYWHSLKQFSLLPDQSVQPLPKDTHILNFHDAEASINDGEIFEEKDELLEQELALADRRTKKEIRHLEAEVGKWQALVDKVRGDSTPDFDNQTLAVLRGRLVRYLMRSKEITLGRTTKDQTVDVDLKLEGPAWKISRRQGVIKLLSTGQFYIANEGKRSIFVDGRPIQRGTKTRLCNNSVLEVAGLKFVFLINQDLIEAIIKTEAGKM